MRGSSPRDLMRRPSARRISSIAGLRPRGRISSGSRFTYVATWRGFVYVAFVIDVFARRIGSPRLGTTRRDTVSVSHRGAASFGRARLNPLVSDPVRMFAFPVDAVNAGRNPMAGTAQSLLPSGGTEGTS